MVTITNACNCDRFECLNLKCLSEAINNKYYEVLVIFSTDIDKIQKVLLFLMYEYRYVVFYAVIPGTIHQPTIRIQYATI